MTLVDKDRAEAEIRTSEKIIALFFADYCPYCRAFRPLFQNVASSSDGDFAEIDITDDDSPFWDEFGISIVPTIIAFSDGGIIARRDGKAHVGLDISDLEGILREVKD
ncbi:MAG: thioredoxin family protein [Thermoplasmata archaeon]